MLGGQLAGEDARVAGGGIAEDRLAWPAVREEVREEAALPHLGPAEAGQEFLQTREMLPFVDIQHVGLERSHRPPCAVFEPEQVAAEQRFPRFFALPGAALGEQADPMSARLELRRGRERIALRPSATTKNFMHEQDIH